MYENTSNAVSQNTTLAAAEVSPFLWNAFLGTCYTSAVFLAVLSVLTTIVNGLLLLALYKDPLKCLRQPPTIMISSLAIADFLTGVLVEPVFSYFYFQVFRDRLTREDYNMLLKVAGSLSGVTMTTSFLTILFLSVMQLIAITFPHRHKTLITKRRVLKCVAGTWVYSTLCAMPLLVGISEDIYKKLSVYLNLTFVHFLVLVTYVALCVSYRRQLRLSSSSLNTDSHSTASLTAKRRRKSQRHLVVVCLLLTTCQVVFVTPVTVMWYITLYWKPKTNEELIKATIANVVVDATLFLKFLIDPFIYTWRLPRFRRAIYAVFRKKSVVATTRYNLSSNKQTNEPFNGCTAYNISARV